MGDDMGTGMGHTKLELDSTLYSSYKYLPSHPFSSSGYGSYRYSCVVILLKSGETLRMLDSTCLPYSKPSTSDIYSAQGTTKSIISQDVICVRSFNDSENVKRTFVHAISVMLR